MAKAPTRKVAYTNDQIVNAATGNWGKVAAEVKAAEPVVINVPDSEETITILPMTPRRRRKLKAAQAAYMLVGAQLAEAQNQGNADQGTVSRIETLMTEAEREYDIALFGSEDLLNRFDELFDDIDEAYRNAAYQLMHDQLVNRIEVDEDVCSKCGRPTETADDDPEPGGKDESSSTSSSNTGAKLKAISGTT